MSISTRNLSKLPDLKALERLCQSIAMLDAILSPEWDNRYFSFNARWNQSKEERMASMRNGSGDGYFMVFSPQGAILKGFDHEAAMSPWSQEPAEVWLGVLNHVPKEFAHFLAEPAFSMDDTTFCIWKTIGDASWQRGPISFPTEGDPDGSQGLLWMLDSAPETYVEFASEYYEQTLSVDAVRKLYMFEPLSQAILSEINAEADWKSVLSDAQEIGYPFITNP